MHVGGQQNPASKLYLPSHPPRQMGARLIFSWEEATQALEVGSGPFGKEFWGPGGQNMGDDMAPVSHAWGRQVPCSEARVEQEEGTGFREHELRLSGSHSGSDEIQSHCFRGS